MGLGTQATQSARWKKEVFNCFLMTFQGIPG